MRAGESRTLDLMREAGKKVGALGEASTAFRLKAAKRPDASLRVLEKPKAENTQNIPEAGCFVARFSSRKNALVDKI